MQITVRKQEIPMHCLILSTTVAIILVFTVPAAGKVLPVRLAEPDNAKTVTVQLARTATIRLKGNPATGYSWFLDCISGSAVTCTGGMTYAANPNRKGLLGAAGTFSCVLTAVQPGTSTVSCAYYRPWEKDKKETTYSVTIIVPPGKEKPAGSGKPNRQDYVTGEVLVGFEKDSTIEERNAVIAVLKGAKIKKKMFQGTIVLVTLPDNISVSNAIQVLQARKGVKYAEPNSIIRLDNR
jgi:predicted secreted protein